MAELPIAPIDRIFKRNANGLKISKEAKELLREALEKEGLEISRKAIQLARDDGRKTVQGKDIRKWIPIEENTDEDYIYREKGRVYIHIDSYYPSVPSKNAKVLPVKFLDNVLVFNNRLYRAEDEIDAKRIMESHEKQILDSLMEPHWAYNIYEYRAWEKPKKINDNITCLSMWFDDYDGGDVIVEGYLINPQ